MSEYEAFYHILNNCSGVIHEKVNIIFGDRLSVEERAELCTLIYYPEERLEIVHETIKRFGKLVQNYVEPVN